MHVTIMPQECNVGYVLYPLLIDLVTSWRRFGGGAPKEYFLVLYVFFCPLILWSSFFPILEWFKFLGSIRSMIGPVLIMVIITTIDYFIRWVEAIPTKRDTSKVIMEFLNEKSITWFGVPTKITTDKSQAFKSIYMMSFCIDYGIVLSHSSNYYPQGNGLA